MHWHANASAVNLEQFLLHNLFITTDHPKPQVIQTRSYTFFTSHLVGKTTKDRTSS